MKYFLLVFLLIACSKEKVESKKKELQLDIKREQKSIGGEYYDHETHFTVRLGACEIGWTALKLKQNTARNVLLRQRVNAFYPCVKSFKDLALYHEKVLKRLLTEYPASTIQSLDTSGLKVLNPSQSWNQEVALASLKSKDWDDYRKFYPKHKSKKSSNQIFVEILRTTQGYKEFTDFFLPLGLTVDLYEVEKVFSSKVADLPYKKSLGEKHQKETVIFDAGHIWWTIK